MFKPMGYNECYRVFEAARDLPAEWDLLIGDNPYMRRDFLAVLENERPPGRKYYLFYASNGAPDTIFVTFHNPAFDVGMLTKKRRLVDMTVVYLPVWVARPGIIFGNQRKADALRFIRKMKGFKILLCVPDPTVKSGFIKATMAPDCVLDVKWSSFTEYMASLRSGYRYRYNKALKKSEALSMTVLDDNAAFSEELYGLYGQVEQNAAIKIEKLTIGFFRSGFFKIIVFKDPSETPVGFVQLLENGEELVFEFVGFDYEANKRYQTYHRMLLEIIRYGIEHGFKRIDFGQTADDTKLKLGCRYEPLSIYIHHSNPILNLAYRVIAPFIDYKPPAPNFTVFKEGADKD